MSYNDGSKLLVFGLGFAHQDTRKMQQVLGHYRKLPPTTNRAVLFAALNALAKELMADPAQHQHIDAVTRWMQDGGPFPLTSPSHPPPVPAEPSRDGPPASHHHHQHHHHHRRRRLPSVRRGHRYQHQYGHGRTLRDPTHDEPDEQDPSSSSSSSEPDQDEYDEMDPLPRPPTFPGPGYRLEGDDDAVTEEADAMPADEAGDFIPATTSSAAVHVDDSVRNDPNEPVNDPAISSTVSDPEDENSRRSLVQVDMHQVFSTDDHNAETEKDCVECPICADEYPVSSFPRQDTITESCTHPEKACLDCLEASIAAVVERGALHLLACPICPAKLTSREVERYASSQVYERYKYLKEQSEIPGHYISCMSPHCGGSQPHESDDPRMICKYCSFATCAYHKRPWHDGQTCAQFDLDDSQIERLEEEEATAKLLSTEDTSICPKCGQGVTKTEGCDHMSCNCGEEWCYICSCSYENVLRVGATAHAVFCIYHPNKVNLTKTQKEAARRKIMGLVHGGEVSAELARARDELRERRRAEIRPKVAEAAEARRKLAMQQQRENGGGAAGKPPSKKKVKLVAPWEEGGWKKRSL